MSTLIFSKEEYFNLLKKIVKEIIYSDGNIKDTDQTLTDVIEEKLLHMANIRQDIDKIEINGFKYNMIEMIDIVKKDVKLLLKTEQNQTSSNHKNRKKLNGIIFQPQILSKKSNKPR